MTLNSHNLFFVIVCFVSTDADVCTDRRELRTCYFYFSTPSSLPTLMKAAIALSSCSRV